MCIALGALHYESQKIKYLDIFYLGVTEIYLWSAECSWHAYFHFSTMNKIFNLVFPNWL